MTGDDIKYPEPAGTVNNALAMFSLQFLNFAPPECANPEADFFYELAIMTLGPFIAIPFIFVYYACIQRAPNAKLKTLAMTIVIFELSLCSVTTTTFRALDCEEFDDAMYLKAQLSIKCEGQRYKWWTRYAYFMIAVYPIGVPVCMLVVLGTFVSTSSLWVSRSTRRAREHGGERAPGGNCADDDSEARIHLVKTLAFLFEKFEPDAWWCGVFEIEIRLFETSFLVFIKRRIMQTLFARCAFASPSCCASTSRGSRTRMTWWRTRLSAWSSSGSSRCRPTTR